MRARYDAAQTTDENRRHFAAADAYSPDVSNSLSVRMILRNRGRYVYFNNPRAKGVIGTVANHTVGEGPRLQLQLGTGAQAQKLSNRIEDDFVSWAKRVNLARKLRQSRIAKAISGEIFAVLGMNPDLNHRVKLDVRLVETDRVTNNSWEMEGNDIDGIFLDDRGDPIAYRILRQHPGDRFYVVQPGDYDDFPARLVLHYFTQERPDQHRGVPDITPAVQLFEEGRRFRAAVLAAAETAADFAMVIYSDATPDDAVQPAPMDTVELERRMATTLPPGWKLAQTKPEQPITGYKEFSRELLGEMARCFHMPLSLASLDANDANMSSSYIINQPYEKAIDVERSEIESCFLGPILDAWLTLAFDPNSDEPIARRVPEIFPHNWFWPLIGEHADPMKRAQGQTMRLAANLTTLSREYAREGLDWEVELTQRAKEKKLMDELGLTDATALPPANQPQDNSNADQTNQQDG
jgi:capsid protein